MTDILAALLLVIGSIGLFSLILSFSVLVNGWALWLLWGWFMVPLLSLPSLTLAQSIGVGMAVSYATYSYVPSKENDKGLFAVVIVRPLVAVLLGLIVKQFI